MWEWEVTGCLLLTSCLRLFSPLSSWGPTVGLQGRQAGRPGGSAWLGPWGATRPSPLAASLMLLVRQQGSQGHHSVGRRFRDLLTGLERKSHPHRGCPSFLFPILRPSGVQDKALSGRLLQNTWRCHRAARGPSVQAPTQSHSHTHSVKASVPAGKAKSGPASLHLQRV